MIEGARYVNAKPMRVAPVTLEGAKVTLVPMQPEHAPALFEAGNFPELWTWTGTYPINSLEAARRYMDFAFSERDAGRALPFVTFDNASGAVIGSTRFGAISLQDHRLEIGWTWLRPDLQRTGANREAKCLMLRQAFDVWTGLRVEFKTDVRNTKSRTAIERIGAKFEGEFRQHMVMGDGRVRSSVYYSILDTEWRDPSHTIHKLAKSCGITPSPVSPA